jgi:Zn-dependent protease with chaperone function
VSLSDLENKALFRRTLWKRNGYLLLLLALEALVLGVLAGVHVQAPGPGEPGNVHPLLGYDVWFFFSWRSLVKIAVFVAIQFGFAHRVFARALDGDGMVSLYPTDASGGRTFGGLTGPEVVVMVRKLADELGIGRLAKLVVADKVDPNAYTARMLGLGNVVVVHSNLLEILPREGVRAVLAHELAHILRRDSVLYQLARMPSLIAVVIAFLGFLKVAAGLLDANGFLQFLVRGLFVALAVAATVYAFRLLNRVANLASQQSELLADAYAAQVCGWEKILNALLLVGERSEALAELTAGLKYVAEKMEGELSEKALLRLLKRFPARELDERKAREAAARLYIEDQLELLKERLHVPLKGGEICHLAAQGARALQAAVRGEAGGAAAGAPAEDAPVLTDWRAFDADHSGALDARETAALVAELRRDPHRMVSRRPLHPEAAWENHPTLRTRILHLYDLFAREPAAP